MIQISERSRGHDYLRKYRNNRLVFSGALLIIFLVASALLAPMLGLADHLFVDNAIRMQPPSSDYFFGTDGLGRDVLSRVLYGGRVSLGIALASVSIAATAGAVVGLLAAFYGTLVDQALMRFMDMLFSLPPLLLAIVIAAALSPSARNATVALALIYTPAFARIVRGSAISEIDKEYVEAARALGASNGRLLYRHILPNSLAPLIVQVSLVVPQAILIESSLSYLGLGTQPPTPSWGGMVSQGQHLMEIAPWLAIFPGLAITLAALAFYWLGDGLRDVLDPNL